jgi:hypothetical protein
MVHRDLGLDCGHFGGGADPDFRLRPGRRWRPGRQGHEPSADDRSADDAAGAADGSAVRGAFDEPCAHTAAPCEAIDRPPSIQFIARTPRANPRGLFSTGSLTGVRTRIRRPRTRSIRPAAGEVPPGGLQWLEKQPPWMQSSACCWRWSFAQTIQARWSMVGEPPSRRPMLEPAASTRISISSMTIRPCRSNGMSGKRRDRLSPGTCFPERRGGVLVEGR